MIQSISVEPDASLPLPGQWCRNIDTCKLEIIRDLHKFYLTFPDFDV